MTGLRQEWQRLYLATLQGTKRGGDVVWDMRGFVRRVFRINIPLLLAY